MTSQVPCYHGYRFPPEIISHAVWLYHRFALSFRDVEDLLAQRSITVTYQTNRQWCLTFGRRPRTCMGLKIRSEQTGADNRRSRPGKWVCVPFAPNHDDWAANGGRGRTPARAPVATGRHGVSPLERCQIAGAPRMRRNSFRRGAERGGRPTAPASMLAPSPCRQCADRTARPGHR